MDNISREQFKQLRQQGHSPAAIKDFAERGRVDEMLNKQTFKEAGLLRKAGEFLNMDEFGRGIGQAAFNISGQNRRNREQILEQGQQTTDTLVDLYREAQDSGDTERAERLGRMLQSQPDFDFEGMGTGGLNNREVIGSAISTGLNIASLRGAKFGAKPVTQAATKLGAIGRGAQMGATAGALFSGAEAITEGEAVVPRALKGAAFGGVTGGVLAGVSKYVDDLTKVTPESRLHETTGAFKTLKRKFNEGAVYQGSGANRKLVSDPISTITKTDVGSQLQVIDGKINTDQARTTVRSLISEFDEDVANAVASSQHTTSISQLKRQAVEQIQKNESLKAAGKVQKTINALDGYFDDYTTSYGDDISMETASAIRREMNRAYNPDTVDVERAIGDTMRKVIYKNVPGAQEKLAQEGQLIAADKFLDALDGRAVKGGRLGGYFANLLGAVAGSSTDIPVVGPLAGALGANKIQQIMQSQQLNPIAPQMARGITSLVNQLPTDSAGNISRTAVINLIAQMSEQSASE